ncbi:membrane protein [Allostella humosa]|nr:sulfite exporter TauE/SafE family protein [Stella humosa]BBK31015.1 membrane protein [Stella humosa]
MMPSPDLIVFSALVFVLAGLVKGVLGFGLPTVVVALLALALPPTQALALLVVPSFATNLAQGAVGGHFVALCRRLWPMGLGIVLGTLVGGRLTAALFGPEAATATRTGLGIALVVYGMSGLLGRPPTLPGRLERLLAGPAGLVSGVMTAACGVFVFPLAPFLQSLGLSRAALSQALGIAFTLATVALAGNLLDGDRLSGRDLLWSVAGLVPALAGMALGMRLRDRMQPAIFSAVFLLGLAGLGLHLALA